MNKKTKIAAMIVVASAAAAIAAPVSGNLLGKSARPATPRTSAAQKAPALKASRGATHTLPVMSGKTPFSQARKSWTGASRGAGIASGEKAPATIPTIYGSIVYNDNIGAETAVAGLYEIPKSAGSQPDLLISGADAQYGGVLIDDIYYATQYMSYFGFEYVMIYGYNVKTGSNDVYLSGTIDNMAPGGITVDPTTGMAYGIFYTEDKSGYQLGTISYGDDMAVTTPIAPLEGNWNSIACDGSGQLYAISYTGGMENGAFVVKDATLNRLNKVTGEVTPVGLMEGIVPQYLSSAVIDSRTNIMYWNYCPAAGESYMCEVDLATAETSILFRLALNDEIMGMYIPTPDADPKAPGECLGVSLDFQEGSLAGKLSLSLPAALFDGSAPSGEVTLTTLVNGETVDTRTSTYGASEEIPVEVQSAGLYTFTVYASNEAGEGPRTNLKHVWVGPDTPAAPKANLEYIDGEMRLTWSPVTVGVNGGYMNLDDLTYTVTRWPDNVVVSEGKKDTSLIEPLAAPETALISYYYTVRAECGGISSAEAKSNSVTLGNIVPPYLNDFEADDCLGGWTIENCNGDDVTWWWENGEVRNSFSSMAADDWLITPPVRLEKGKAYYVHMDVRGTSTTWTERIEIKYGRTPDAAGMTETLIPALELTTNDPINIGELLAPLESGIYYIGLHSISDPDQLEIVVDNFQIDEGTSALSPGTVSNFKVTPDIDGALSAVVSLNAPAVDIAGEPLAEVTKVELYRGDVLLNTFEDLAPGDLLSYSDNVDAEGLYTYRAIGYNRFGTGLSSEVTNFIGVNRAEMPPSATASAQVGSGVVTVTWEPSTVDVNGNPLRASNVRYNVYRIQGNSRELLEENLDVLTYSFSAVEPGEQKFVQCAVFAVTGAGESDGRVTDMVAVGTPYEGLDENFADGDVRYDFAAESIEGATWELCTDARFNDIKSRDGDNGFLSCKMNGYGSGAEFVTGLVSLDKFDKPGTSFYVYNVVDGVDDDDNIVKVMVRDADGGEYSTLLEGTVNDLCNGVQGWNRLTVSLADYAGKVVQVKYVTMAGVYMYTCLDDLFIGHLAEFDLMTRSVAVPDYAVCGSEFEVKAVISNEGTGRSGVAYADLYADGKVVSTLEIPALDPGFRADATFVHTMPCLASEPMACMVVVRYEADENNDNDSSVSVEVRPLDSTLPGVRELKGEVSGGNVALSWREPDLSNAIPVMTEDFEGGQGFADTFGDWTFVDVDGSPVGGFQTMDVPGITIGKTTGSFWVWDTAELASDNLTFAAHSGTKYLFSLFREDDGESDNWAISPELNGSSQTISFYARSYSASYPEKIEVWYSTGSLDVKDFVRIEGAGFDEVPYDWTLCQVTLPQGAKHFAIRSCATGSFMLMLDDFTYAPAGLSFDAILTGYDVYRDGEKLNVTPIEENGYEDAAVVAGESHTYHVVAVYDRGMSVPSDPLLIDTSGVAVLRDGVTVEAGDGTITVTGAEGEHLTVATASGMVIYNGVASERTIVRTGTGVHIVTVGPTPVKLLVK